MNKYIIITIILVSITGLIVFLNNKDVNNSINTKVNNISPVTEKSNKVITTLDKSKINVTMYKSPTCGCCGGFASAMEKQGYNVTTVKMDNMNTIKDKFNLPMNKQSCHTSVIGDYFVEGHVPLEVIEKLLTEKPDIDGIGMAGMPAGTPGMPGKKNGVYFIYQVNNNEFTEYVTL